MTSEEVKHETELCYSQIESAKKRLEELKEICDHKDTYEGYYSYRIGVCKPAIICCYCNKLISYK